MVVFLRGSRVTYETSAVSITDLKSSTASGNAMARNSSGMADTGGAAGFVDCPRMSDFGNTHMTAGRLGKSDK